MTSRKRKENESFEGYRSSLKAEAKEEKRRAKGTLIWNSRRGTAISDKRQAKRERTNG